MFQREEINHSRNCPHVKFQISVKESESHSVVSAFLQLHGHSPWNSLGQNIGVGSLSLLQGIFPSQGSSPGLLHWRWMFYQLSHQGSPSVVLNQWLVMIQNDPEGWDGERGGRAFRMGNTCTPVVDSYQCMSKPIQYCTWHPIKINKFN